MENNKALKTEDLYLINSHLIKKTDIINLENYIDNVQKDYIENLSKANITFRDFMHLNAYFAINISSPHNSKFKICTELIRQYIKSAKDLKEKSLKKFSDANNNIYSILNYVSIKENEQDKIEDLLSVGISKNSDDNIKKSQTIDINTVASIDELYKIYNRICEINSDLEDNGKYVLDTYARYTTELKMYILLLAYIHYFKHIFLPKRPNNNSVIKECISKDERNLIANTHKEVTYDFFKIFLNRNEYKNNRENSSQPSTDPQIFYFPNINIFFRPINRDKKLTNKKIPLENPILTINKLICFKNGYLIFNCPLIKTKKLDPNKDVINQILECPYIFEPSTEQLNKTQNINSYPIHYWCQNSYKEDGSCMNNRCAFFDETQYYLFYYTKKINLSINEFIYYFPISLSKSQISNFFKDYKYLTKHHYNTIFQSSGIPPEYFMDDFPNSSNGLSIISLKLDKFMLFICRNKLNDFCKYFSTEFDDFEKQDADHSDKINKIDMKYINLAIEALNKNRKIDGIPIFAKTHNKIINKLNSIK